MSGSDNKKLKQKLREYCLEKRIPIRAKTANRWRRLKRLRNRGVELNKALEEVSRIK